MKKSILTVVVISFSATTWGSPIEKAAGDLKSAFSKMEELTPGTPEKREISYNEAYMDFVTPQLRSLSNAMRDSTYRFYDSSGYGSTRSAIVPLEAVVTKGTEENSANVIIRTSWEPYERGGFKVCKNHKKGKTLKSYIQVEGIDWYEKCPLSARVKVDTIEPKARVLALKIKGSSDPKIDKKFYAVRYQISNLKNAKTTSDLKIKGFATARLELSASASVESDPVVVLAKSKDFAQLPKTTADRLLTNLFISGAFKDLHDFVNAGVTEENEAPYIDVEPTSVNELEFEDVQSQVESNVLETEKYIRKLSDQRKLELLKKILL